VQNRSGEFVYGEGLGVDVTYSRYVTEPITAAEDVNVDVAVSDTISDGSDDVDAFTESFT